MGVNIRLRLPAERLANTSETLNIKAISVKVDGTWHVGDAAVTALNRKYASESKDVDLLVQALAASPLPIGAALDVDAQAALLGLDGVDGNSKLALPVEMSDRAKASVGWRAIYQPRQRDALAESNV